MVIKYAQISSSETNAKIQLKRNAETLNNSNLFKGEFLIGSNIVVCLKEKYKITI